MGIFKRIQHLLRANINALISTAERPDVMLEQLMADLREERRQAHLQVVKCIADEKRLEQQVREHQEKLGQWQKRAEVAVMRDEDDLAREAIGRRNEFATMVDELTRQWEEQHQMAEQLKDALEQLDRRLKEAEFKKQHLLNKHRAAQAGQRASDTISKLSNTSHLEEFAKVEAKISEMSAMTSAQNEVSLPALDQRFAQLEEEGVVEHDLMQLKLQMGKSIPELAAGNGAGPAALPGAPVASSNGASSSSGSTGGSTANSGGGNGAGDPAYGAAQPAPVEPAPSPAPTTFE